MYSDAHQVQIQRRSSRGLIPTDCMTIWKMFLPGVTFRPKIDVNKCYQATWENNTCLTRVSTFPSASPGVKSILSSLLSSPTFSRSIEISTLLKLSRSSSPSSRAFAKAALIFFQIAVGETGATALMKCFKATWRAYSMHLIMFLWTGWAPTSRCTYKISCSWAVHQSSALSIWCSNSHMVVQLTAALSTVNQPTYCDFGLPDTNLIGMFSPCHAADISQLYTWGLMWCFYQCVVLQFFQMPIVWF